MCISVTILFPSKLCFGATSMMVSGVKATWWSSQCSHKSSDHAISTLAFSQKTRFCHILRDIIHRLHPWFWVVRIPREQSCSARICES